MLLWFIVYLLTVSWTTLAQRSCSRDLMQQCQDRIVRNTQARINVMSRSEMDDQCRKVREDLNCLLTQTRCLTSESDRNRNGDAIRNALKYIRDGCESGGGSWRDSNCYSEYMKSCESSYPLGGVQYASYNADTCRKFNLFLNCVTNTLQSRCRRDDELLVGQYLVDSAQDLAWNCGESTSSSSSGYDRSRDDRYNDRRDDRRDDRYEDRYRNGERDRDSWRTNYRSRDGDGYGDSSGRDRYSDRYNNGYRGNAYLGSSDVTCCRSERCDRSRLQLCRDSVSRTIDNRMTGYQDSSKCRKIRDDFNCFLWQTSNCLNRDERDRDNDIFRRARDYITRNCDSFGRWTENSCYKTTEMQRCEALLSNTRGGANYEACRAYNSFKECMTQELTRRCTRDDELYQGAYLVDKAQEMAWQCGDEQFNGRSQYTTFDRREPYDNYGRQDGYEGSPLHLEDEDAQCMSRVQSYTDKCKETLDDKKKDLYIENNYDTKQKITCCSIRQYRSCLFDATRRVCQSERSRVVDSLMGGYRHQLNADNCRRIYDNDCNAGTHNHMSLLLLGVCLAVLSALFSFRP